MKKSIGFILILAVIILAQAWGLYRYKQNPSLAAYNLATAEFALPEPDISGIQPFVFETDWANEVSRALRNIRSIIYKENLQISPLSAEDEKVYQKASATKGKARVAVVIDDVGLSVPFTNQLAELEKPVTVAFLPYGASNKQQVMKLKNRGFEVMLHAPMMPHTTASLAPNTLSPQMSKEEIQRGFKTMLERFAGTGMVGANNHMGSLFTEDTAAMSAIMPLLKADKMFFLDSKTSSKSVARSVCLKYGVPYIARDVFLDNEKDYGKIMRQFEATEHIAKKTGSAVAIGHPYKQTLQALKDWEKGLNERGIELVPLSYLVYKTK